MLNLEVPQDGWSVKEFSFWQAFDRSISRETQNSGSAACVPTIANSASPATERSAIKTTAVRAADLSTASAKSITTEI